MASTQRQIQPVFQAASRFEAFDVSVKSQPPQLGRLQGKTNSCLKKKKKKRQVFVAAGRKIHAL